ncbi:MAG: inorganic pyrophosphatase [Deltaproteobacteria bacterium]|nr:MAG: inorganic pyrophosphatase [Deltaproteobacteria bacterium]
MKRAATVTIRVDTPLGGVVKRRDDGSVDYVSPLPCPFNYGCIPQIPSTDGDALDAVLLGPRLSAGSHAESRAWAVVDFLDAGEEDPKLVCGAAPPTPAEQRRVVAFFTVYARLKGLLNRARGRAGATAYQGWRWLEDDATGSGTPYTR